MESRDVPLLRRMYYPQLDAGDTGLDPLVVVEVDSPRDAVVEQRVKIEEVKEDDNNSVKPEVSRALLSLKQ